MSLDKIEKLHKKLVLGRIKKTLVKFLLEAGISQVFSLSYVEDKIYAVKKLVGKRGEPAKTQAFFAWFRKKHYFTKYHFLEQAFPLV